MRICLVSTTTLDADPRALAEAGSLSLVGHEITGVSSAGEADWVETPGLPGTGDRLMGRTSSQRLSRLIRGVQADIFQPVHPTALDIAAAGARTRPTASILVKPGWPRPGGQDLIEMAPVEPWRSRPASGYTARFHVPGSGSPPALTGASGRVVIAYRRTERSPGRYLEAAMIRAGLDVQHVEVIDWDSVHPSTRLVVIVESPLPALPVRGANPGIPVVFWVHHGEHHVDANVRLQRRYGAHGVLMAHSWHLSHRFAGLVDRFPFAAAPELFSRDFRQHSDRPWLIGFVGSVSEDSRYSARSRLLAELHDSLGDRVAARSGVAPEQMAELYLGSRIVIDDGAGRHLPITMRVFEATAAGALLMTNPGPGTSLLLEPGKEYVPLPEEGGDIVALLEDDTETVARSGHAATWARHTYDHRVAELLAVSDSIKDLKIEAPDQVSEIEAPASIVERFSDAQRVLDLGGSLQGALTDREVWRYEDAAERAEPGTFHVSVIVGGGDDEVTRAVAAARTAVITPNAMAAHLADRVGAAHPGSERHELGSYTAFTFGSSGYRVSPSPDPS